MAEHHLDARHLLCPLPVIRVQNTVKTLSAGDRLLVTCTDPGSKKDIPMWCRIHGHAVEKMEEQGRSIQFVIRVGTPA